MTSARGIAFLKDTSYHGYLNADAHNIYDHMLRDGAINRGLLDATAFETICVLFDLPVLIYSSLDLARAMLTAGDSRVLLEHSNVQESLYIPEALAFFAR
jgi:hypothetical protein